MNQWFRASIGVFATAAAFALPAQSQAQAWPTQPIRVIVPFQAGDLADVIARMVSQKMSEDLGQPVVVENRPGASGLLGLQTAMQAPPDGHTVVMGQMGGMAVAPNINRQPFDVRDEFKGVAGMYSNYMLLVAANDFAPKTLGEIIDFAKANPGKLTMASNGLGGFPHLAFEQIRREAGGFEYTHVPYKGSAQIPADIISGRVDVTILGYSTLMPHVQAGRMKAVAITGTERNPMSPDVQTAGERLKGYSALGWFGMFARTGTPADAVQKLNASVNKALAMPEVQERAKTMGLDLMKGTPEDFDDTWKRDHQKWGQLIRDLKLERS
jgi:tripartite-type tricarboxylate transporter receptor subunit TctC